MQFIWMLLATSGLWYGQTACIDANASCAVAGKEKSVKISAVAPRSAAAAPVTVKTGKVICNVNSRCTAEKSCCTAVAEAGAEPKSMVWFAGPGNDACVMAPGAGNAVWVAKDGQPQTYVIAGKGDDDPHVMTYAVTLADDDTAATVLPKHWIGIRTTDVPKALAAHIGNDGVMVANVAVDSPADAAGLQQYDVIVRFGERDVHSMKDLLDAIGATEPGDNARMEIIRGGKHTTLKIAPAERPAEGSIEFRYDEPQDTVIDGSTSFSGHRLVPSPDGGWTLEPLGAMPQFPAILKKLPQLRLDANGQNDFDVFFGNGTNDQFQKIRISPEGDAKIELEICVDKDGNRLSLHRNADGTIHVERHDANDNESEATYDNADDLKAEDEEAYELYQQHMGGQTFGWRVAAPPNADLNDLRQQFQIRVEPKLQAAIKRSVEQTKRVEKHGDVDVRKGASQKDEALSVRIDDDGAITITVHVNGDRTVYKFDSKKSLKSEEPKLYEKVKRLLD